MAQETFDHEHAHPRHGLDVLRRAERLHELAERLTDQHRVTCRVLTTDLTDPGAPDELMITAVTQLAHLVVPDMKARGHGRIVNLSLLAAFAPPGESLLHTGIKTYVLGTSQALGTELKPDGMRPIPFRAQYALGRSMNPFKSSAPEASQVSSPPAHRA